MKILIENNKKPIVDDLSRQVMELYPYATVDGVTGAAQALELVGENHYDIALLDIEMPGMDGLNLARRLTAIWPVLNIIFVTGHREYALEAHDLYCSAFLLKPVGRRKLKEAFDNLRKPIFDIPENLYADHYSGGAVIGGKFSLLREQRGLSRQELADLMNVTRQTIYRWEHGERIPDVLTFIRLVRLLGVDISSIFDLHED